MPIDRHARIENEPSDKQTRIENELKAEMKEGREPSGEIGRVMQVPSVNVHQHQITSG